MSTERLYYTDAYLTSFDARVVRCVPRTSSDAREAFAVELDRTAFYPTCLLYTSPSPRDS